MREANVHRLEPTAEEPPVNEVVATGVQIVVSLAPDRQMTFASMFAADEDDATVNERFDRLMRIADRLKGKYEIPDIEEDLERSKEALRNLVTDLARLDKQHDHEQAVRRVELSEMDALLREDLIQVDRTIDSQILRATENKAAAEQRGIEEYRRSGKMGSFVPRGSVKSDMEKCEAAITTFQGLRSEEKDRLTAEYEQRKVALQGQIDKAQAERELHRDNQKINVERHEKGIADLEKKLARARALAGG